MEPPGGTVSRYDAFERELASLINRHSLENDSNTPDWVLAKYLVAFEAVLHDDNCINVHFPNSGRCCDCDRPQRQ